MSKITYANKTALNENTGVADANKVNANDMNEIKTVVNANDDTMNAMIVNEQSNSTTNTYSCDYINNCNTYSTSEFFTGQYWINNKPIFGKTLVITSFSQSLVYNHTISNMDEMIDVRGFALLDGKWQPIQRVVTDAIEQYGIGVGDITSSQFLLQIGVNYQTKTKANITFYYTKSGE